jgi:hypothetical protein
MDGIVSLQDEDGVIGDAVRALSAVRDPDTGKVLVWCVCALGKKPIRSEEVRGPL